MAQKEGSDTDEFSNFLFVELLFFSLHFLCCQRKQVWKKLKVQKVKKFLLANQCSFSLKKVAKILAGCNFLKLLVYRLFPINHVSLYLPLFKSSMFWTSLIKIHFSDFNEKSLHLGWFHNKDDFFSFFKIKWILDVVLYKYFIYVWTWKRVQNVHWVGVWKMVQLC